MFAQKKDKEELSPEQQVKSAIYNCEKAFRSARTKNDFTRLQTQLEQLYGVFSTHKLPQFENTVLELLRKVKLNLNFMFRFEDLRNRFLEGETEAIYTELINANREAMRPENGELLPEILTRIQRFLERISLLINPPTVEREYVESTPNPVNEITRFGRISLNSRESQSEVKDQERNVEFPRKISEKKKVEGNETTIYWPSHHSES